MSDDRVTAWTDGGAMLFSAAILVIFTALGVQRVYLSTERSSWGLELVAGAGQLRSSVAELRGAVAQRRADLAELDATVAKAERVALAETVVLRRDLEEPRKWLVAVIADSEVAAAEAEAVANKHERLGFQDQQEGLAGLTTASLFLGATLSALVALMVAVIRLAGAQLGRTA